MSKVKYNLNYDSINKTLVAMIVLNLLVLT